MKATLAGRHSMDTQFHGITALSVRVTDTRLGSRGWRLHDTPNGRALKRVKAKRPRHAVTTNMPKVERVLPILDDSTQERIMRTLAGTLASERDTNALNINVHTK